MLSQALFNLDVLLNTLFMTEAIAKITAFSFQGYIGFTTNQVRLPGHLTWPDDSGASVLQP